MEGYWKLSLGDNEHDPDMVECELASIDDVFIVVRKYIDPGFVNIRFKKLDDPTRF